MVVRRRAVSYSFEDLCVLNDSDDELLVDGPTQVFRAMSYRDTHRTECGLGGKRDVVWLGGDPN
jgi:hypothetical protein